MWWSNGLGLGTGNGFYSVLKSDDTCGDVVCDVMRLYVLAACWDLTSYCQFCYVSRVIGPKSADTQCHLLHCDV